MGIILRGGGRASHPAPTSVCAAALCVLLFQAKLLLRMLAYLSESIKDAFMVDELRARIAEMLGYFLDHLVGKKSKDLKARGAWGEVYRKKTTVVASFLSFFLSFLLVAGAGGGGGGII